MALTHRDIEQQEIVERYVKNELSADERRPFQEHSFTCDDCFAQVETTTRFIAGVRDAARRGLLDADIAKGAQPVSWSRWFLPSFAIPVAASLILAVAVGWLLLYREPRMQTQLEQERQRHEQIARQSQQNLNQTEEQLRLEREARARMETQLAQQEQEKTKLENHIAANTPPRNVSPGEVFANRSASSIPVVMLEATRDGGAPSGNLDVPAGAKNFMLWIEVAPETRFKSYRLQIYGNQSKLLQTVRGLKRNSYGALAVSFPTRSFQAGSYLVELYAEDGQRTDLVGEYHLQIRKL
jgi:hypothetical protein